MKFFPVRASQAAVLLHLPAMQDLYDEQSVWNLQLPGEDPSEPLLPPPFDPPPDDD